jgi:hypothetical protein
MVIMKAVRPGARTARTCQDRRRINNSHRSQAYETKHSNSPDARRPEDLLRGRRALDKSSGQYLGEPCLVRAVLFGFVISTPMVRRRKPSGAPRKDKGNSKASGRSGSTKEPKYRFQHDLLPQDDEDLCKVPKISRQSIYCRSQLS